MPIGEAERAWADANRLSTEAAAWVPLRWYLDRRMASDRLTGAYWHHYYGAIDWVNAGVTGS